jgi:integrase
MKALTDAILKLTDTLDRIFSVATDSSKSVQYTACKSVLIDNLITKTNENDFSNSKLKEDEKYMRKIIEMKNCCKLSDGRYRFQKMQNGKRYEIKERDPKAFIQKVQEIKKALKDNKEIKHKHIVKYRLVDECKKYLELYKDGEHKGKLLGVWKNHMQGLVRDIREYLPDDIQQFRNGFSGFKKVDKQVILILNPVFNNFVARRIIPINPLTGTKSKAIKSDKREWIHIDDQKTIIDNIFNPSTPTIKRHVDKLGDEWLFYFVSSCRDEEALNVTPFWDKGIIHINGTKTDNAPRYIKLSPYACDYFASRWDNMWKRSQDPHYYSKNTPKFLKALGIQGKSLHNFRHSFSTNIFYLGATEDQHQYAMGHSDIKFTKKVYTKYDPTVNKQDILNVWGEWYPTDFDMSNVLKLGLNHVPKNVLTMEKVVTEH